MRTRGLVLVPLLCVALAACSSSSKSSTPTTTAGAPTTTAVAATTTPATTTTTGTSTPPTAVAPAATRQSAYIVSVDLATHKVTIDPMQFLTGAAATAAYKKAYPKSQETGAPDDYFIVNPTKDHVVLPLSATAIVKLVHVGGTDHTQPVKVPQANLAGYPGLAHRPFWITTIGGTITEIDEQFIP